MFIKKSITYKINLSTLFSQLLYQLILMSLIVFKFVNCRLLHFKGPSYRYQLDTQLIWFKFYSLILK